MNILIFIANILDPRDKIEFMGFSLNAIYGELQGGSLFKSVKSALYELFEDYAAFYKPVNESASQSCLSNSRSLSQSESGAGVHAFGTSVSVLKSKFKKFKMEEGIGGSKKNDPDLYLNEAIIEEDGNFDILRWWKLNSKRFQFFLNLLVMFWLFSSQLLLLKVLLVLVGESLMSLRVH